MIEINLLPGTGKKTRSRSVGVDIGGALATVMARVKDPFLIGAIASVLMAAALVGSMFWYQRATGVSLDERLQRAEQDSIRFSAVIREKRKAEAQRDSVVHQVELIKSFDNKRFVWPHLMDEISRALPPYTWVTSVTQTNLPNAQAATPPPPTAAKAAAGKKANSAADDSLQVPNVHLRIVGNTVDIQALTRFMKLLEASPFIENVQLVRSTLILVDNKEVTEFQLDATYQTPDPSAIRTVPVTLSVR